MATPSWQKEEAAEKEEKRPTDESRVETSKRPEAVVNKSGADANTGSKAPGSKAPGQVSWEAPGSLYCFSVMMAGGYEEKLLRMQLGKGVSIFACESYTVMSSTVVDLGTDSGGLLHVKSDDIGSLKCNFGGPWNLALNSEIFVRAWRHVFKKGIYRDHSWSVKVDPDAVFFPGRLLKRVERHDAISSSYLNDCDQGLHGPLEVISRGGMETFREGISNCTKSLKHEFWTWGEDVFLRHCLGLLHVQKVDDFRLLSEPACFNEHPDQDGCSSGKVAFHPFKSIQTYETCLDKAGGLPEG